MTPTFQFTPENLEIFQEILARYPNKRAAMLPTLHLAQQQHSYISPEVERYVAELLEVPVVDVREILTFYTLFQQHPQGEHHIRLCMSISCWIRGAKRIQKSLETSTGVASGETTPDRKISWEAVPDCLGACELAPMIQVGPDYYGHLTPESVAEVLERIQGSGSDRGGDR